MRLLVVDKEFIGVVALIGLVFLMESLPSWTSYNPSLSIKTAFATNTSVSFSVKYSVPEVKSCFLVVYGPFAFNSAGHEEGNNIYVLTANTGTITDTLLLQPEASLNTLNVELWCDNDRLSSVNKIL